MGRAVGMGQDGATALDTTQAGVLTTALGLLLLALCSVRSVAPVLEAELRCCLAERDLAQLATLPATGIPDLAATVSARTATWGIEISDVRVGRIDARVDAVLVRWANAPGARG